MRLLFITNVFPSPCQPTKGLFNLYLARALARNHEVRVVSPISWADEWSARHNEAGGLGVSRSTVLDGVEVHYPRYYYPPKVLRHHHAWFFWRSIRATVGKLLYDRVPDAVLGYWVYPDSAVAAHVAGLVGVPMGTIVGGSDVLLLPKERRMRRRTVEVLQEADAIFTVSQSLQDAVGGFGIPLEKVHVWSQGVDVDRFFPGDRVAARRRLGIPAEQKSLLWVGRMHPVKGLDVLLQCCATLRDRGRPFHLYLVGDGPLQKTLQEQVAARALTGAVTFVGPQQHHQLPDWYRATDLTVLPSWSEGLPNVLRESLACGTPFVASRVGGIPEIAGGGRNRLVTPGDAAGLADALAEGLDGPPPPEAVTSHSAGWAESARALLDTLRPLVEAAQAPDRPWWSGRTPAPVSPDAPVDPWSWRQLLRRQLAAVLPRRRFLVSGPARSRGVCLTFDDGPHPDYTPRLLDVLRDQGITATFFVVGRLAERYPELVRRMAAEGHAVGNHSWLHARLADMTTREALDGVARTQQVLTELMGAAPTLYRPPRGELGVRKLLGLWRLGLSVVLWNVDPRDYACRSAEDMRAWFRRRPLQGGDVVLFHDRLPLALEVLPDLIAKAREEGLNFARVPDWTHALRTVGQVADLPAGQRPAPQTV